MPMRCRLLRAVAFINFQEGFKNYPSQIFFLIERINVKNGSFDPCCFSEAQTFVFNVMENRFVLIFT